MKKRCSKCEREKELKEFYKDKRYQYGVKSICKECETKHLKSTYWENIEKSRAKNRTENKKGSVRKYYRRQSRQLTDVYIKKELAHYVFGFGNYKLISPVAIQLKREQIMLHRELKTLKRALANGSH